MRNFVLGPALAAAILVAAAPASASTTVSVLSTTSTPTLLTSIVAGTTYHLTATGSSNLLENSGLDFNANGIPLGPIGGNYTACYPAGCAADPTSGNYGAGGASALLGSLLGTFIGSPSGPADFFVLGADYSFTAMTSGSLYGLVNDVAAYSDNKAGTGFKVTIDTVGGETGPTGPGGSAVPEPATWALMISGFGMVGATLRRRTAKVVAA